MPPEPDGVAIPDDYVCIEGGGREALHSGGIPPWVEHRSLGLWNWFRAKRERAGKRNAHYVAKKVLNEARDIEAIFGKPRQESRKRQNRSGDEQYDEDSLGIHARAY